MVSRDIIKERIKYFHSILPDGVSLVAVSKFQPVEAIQFAYEAGQRMFGESRVQELLTKIPQLPQDIKWHFIGHLQTNKVKSIIGKTSLIESVDSLRLLEIIDKESLKAGVVTDILLQVHVAAEETKFGFTPDELKSLYHEHSFADFPNVNICGLMGMATNTDDEKRVRADFAVIAALFREVADLNPGLNNFKYISMGMSGDWQLAVDEGSNMVRIGTALFGQRNY